MQRISLNEEHTKEAVEKAADALRAGGVILYPTDTLYGLGADAFSDDAVAKVFAIKGRDEGKPVHALVSSVEMAERYGEVNDLARQLLEELPRGKVTFVVPKKASTDSGICRGVATFGFRIPDNELCIALVGAFGKPITATSANRSGQKPARDAEGILLQLGETAEKIDLVIDGGKLPPREPSTVVDCAGKEPVILREGAVAAADIWEAIRAKY